MSAHENYKYTIVATCPVEHAHNVQYHIMLIWSSGHIIFTPASNVIAAALNDALRIAALRLCAVGSAACLTRNDETVII
jgi:hypothetical protein